MKDGIENKVTNTRTSLRTHHQTAHDNNLSHQNLVRNCGETKRTGGKDNTAVSLSGSPQSRNWLLLKMSLHSRRVKRKGAVKICSAKFYAVQTVVGE